MFPTFLFLCLAGSIIGLQSRKPDSADRGITASWDWRRKGGGGGGKEEEEKKEKEEEKVGSRIRRRLSAN